MCVPDIDPLPLHPESSNLNELCYPPQPRPPHPNYSAQWAAGRHRVVFFFLFLFSLIFFLSLFIITNSRDGTAARGGLGCRLEAWVSLPPSILRTISALQGETSPRTEHLSSRAAAQSKLGVTDCEERKRKGRGDDLAPDSLPPRFHLHQHHHHHRLLLLLLHLLSPIWISGLWGRRYAAQGEPQPLSKTQITRAGSAARIRYCSDAARRRDCACKYLSGCLILRVCGVSARSVRLGGGCVMRGVGTAPS